MDHLEIISSTFEVLNEGKKIQISFTASNTISMDAFIGALDKLMDKVMEEHELLNDGSGELDG